MVVVLELICTSGNTCYIHYKEEKKAFAKENTVKFNFLIGKPSTCVWYHVKAFFPLCESHKELHFHVKDFFHEEEKSKDYPLFGKQVIANICMFKFNLY